jgi:hypothetical protein
MKKVKIFIPYKFISYPNLQYTQIVELDNTINNPIKLYKGYNIFRL